MDQSDSSTSADPTGTRTPPHPPVLIDEVIKALSQLIAQLATASQERAPLRASGDRFFVQLNRALLDTGLTKNVVADMFGLTPRTYHRRVRALLDSEPERHSVWLSVLDFVSASAPVSQARVLARFGAEDDQIVRSVINDLARSGLIARDGYGDQASLLSTSDERARQILASDDALARENIVWLRIYRRGPIDEACLRQECDLEPSALSEHLAALQKSNRIRAIQTAAGVSYTCDQLHIPVNTLHGWEAAVLDHFQAMVTALCLKLGASKTPGGAPIAGVGGATYSFDVSPQHPLYDEATSLLERVRRDCSELRNRVDARDSAPSPDLETTYERVVFYFGQYIDHSGQSGNP